jgi:NAD(P)H dehydrogenase (quinone)
LAVKVTVIYYSAMGHVYRLARAVEEGAKEAGAEKAAILAGARV